MSHVFPYGWFAVCPSQHVKRGSTHGFRAFDLDWVAYRTQTGALKVARGRCPHLGGDLGRIGIVNGESVECGLHRRRFDDAGNALRHDGSRCEGALNHAPVTERGGMLFFWYDPDQGPPRFDLPELDRQDRRWSGWQHKRLLIPTRPALIMQDLADLDHFVAVHDYRRPEPIKPLSYSDYGMHTHMGFFWDTGLPGQLRFIRAEFESTVAGMGFQYTETLSLKRKYGTRHLVLPTPVSPHLTQVWLAVSSQIRPTVGVGAGIALKPLAHLIASQAFWRDIDRDATLWRHQQQTIDPTTTRDPSVRTYREWAQRFFESPRVEPTA